METKLVIVRGKANKGHVTVNLPIIIGRSREADLTVAHPMISRQHCRLSDAEGQVVVRDLESLNGTFVGEERIEEVVLLPESEFSVGPLTFRVVYQTSGEPHATSTPPVDSDPVSIAPANGQMPDFSAWEDEESTPFQPDPGAEQPELVPPEPEAIIAPRADQGDEPSEIEPDAPPPVFEAPTPAEPSASPTELPLSAALLPEDESDESVVPAESEPVLDEESTPTPIDFDEVTPFEAEAAEAMQEGDEQDDEEDDEGLSDFLEGLSS